MQTLAAASTVSTLAASSAGVGVSSDAGADFETLLDEVGSFAPGSAPGSAPSANPSVSSSPALFAITGEAGTGTVDSGASTPTKIKQTILDSRAPASAQAQGDQSAGTTVLDADQSPVEGEPVFPPSSAAFAAAAAAGGDNLTPGLSLAPTGAAGGLESVLGSEPSGSASSGSPSPGSTAPGSSSHETPPVSFAGAKGEATLVGFSARPSAIPSPSPAPSAIASAATTLGPGQEGEALQDGGTEGSASLLSALVQSSRSSQTGQGGATAADDASDESTSTPSTGSSGGSKSKIKSEQRQDDSVGLVMVALLAAATVVSPVDGAGVSSGLGAGAGALQSPGAAPGPPAATPALATPIGNPSAPGEEPSSSFQPLKASLAPSLTADASSTSAPSPQAGPAPSASPTLTPTLAQAVPTSSPSAPAPQGATPALQPASSPPTLPSSASAPAPASPWLNTFGQSAHPTEPGTQASASAANAISPNSIDAISTSPNPTSPNPTNLVSPSTGASSFSDPTGSTGAASSLVADASGTAGTTEFQGLGGATTPLGGKFEVAGHLVTPVTSVADAAAGSAIAASGSQDASLGQDASQDPSFEGQDPQAMALAGLGQISVAAQDQAGSTSAPPTDTASQGGSDTTANLAAAVAQRLNGQSSRFDVQLDPAGLGRVTVSVEIGLGGSMSAAFAFEKPEAASLINAHSAELQQSMAQAGFTLNNANISISTVNPDGSRTPSSAFFGGGQNADSGASNQGGGQAQSAGRAFGAASLAADQTDQITTAAQSLRARGLDIRI